METNETQQVNFNQFLIVKIETFVGSDTYLRCGTLDEDGTENEQSLYFVVHRQSGNIVDAGYRSLKEAATAWPHALHNSE